LSGRHLSHVDGVEPKFLRLLEISSSGVSGEMVKDNCLNRLFGILGEGKVVEIIFLLVGFDG
jgi:hypothetical protein